MTVDEFTKLPEDSGPVYHELRHGELVTAPRPKYKHYTVQQRLRRLLGNAAPEDGLVGTEFSYRAVLEYDVRVADVVFVRGSRERSIDPNDYLQGAPDIVIEVLSPSNTAAEIHDKEKLCLENGAAEFWVVDADRRQVKVSTPDGRTVTWHAGEEIPLPLFGNAKLGVDQIFG